MENLYTMTDEKREEVVSEIDRLVESGEIEIILEKISFHTQILELLARALVNKINKA